MNLKSGEQILKIYYHHWTPYVLEILLLILGVTPFYFLLFFLREAFNPQISTIIFFVISLVFFLAFLYVSLTYWLDRLIVTNIRIVHIDYKYLTIKNKSQALLEDIQDIKTREKGLLAFIKFLDYGLLTIDTSSSRVSIVFDNAPDPDGIRQFINHIKPH